MNPSYDNGFGSFGSGEGGARVGGVSGGAGNSSGVGIPNNMGQAPMAHTGVPISSGAGDVIIGGVPEKKSKKGLIFALVLSVVVAVGVGVVWGIVQNWSSNGEGGVTAREDWDEYYNLLVYGPGQGETAKETDEQEGIISVTDWFLFNVNNEVDTSDAYYAYYDELKKSYEVFRDKIAKNDDKYGGYLEMADAFWAVSPLEGLKDNLLNKYLNEGVNSVQEYIKNLVGSGFRVETLRLYVGGYLDAELRVIESYNEYGCYDAEEIELCIIEIEDDEVGEYVSISNNRYKELENYYKVVFLREFLSETAHMNVLMEGAR